MKMSFAASEVQKHERQFKGAGVWKSTTIFSPSSAIKAEDTVASQIQKHHGTIIPEDLLRSGVLKVAGVLL